MKTKKNILKSNAFQTILSSLLCILFGVIICYIVLLCINPAGANEAMTTILQNFLAASKANLRLKNFGSTLVKTAPLIMCGLSIQFCYKTGLFNIGAAGQYAVGAGISLYAALAWNLPWFVCLLLATAVGALWGAIVGFLKAYRNVNEVISGIMLNWIGLYLVNMLTGNVKESTSPYTIPIKSVSKQSLLPSLGLENLFGGNKYVGIAIPLAIIIAIVIYIIQQNTTLGYVLIATGYNKEAAKYAGMKGSKNIIITLIIGGALAGMGAGMYYLTGMEQWTTTSSSVPDMGFNGIAATFLGGLNPIGTVFAAYFIEHITLGGSKINLNVYPSQIADLMSAIIIYLCGFTLFFKYCINTYLRNKEERAAKATVEVTKDDKAKEGGEGK